MFGLQFAADLGISLIEVETDCQALVTLLKFEDLALSYIGILFGNISELAELVGVLSFDYCSRVCNGVAYRLAQMGFLLETKTHWVSDAPSVIQDVVMEDSL